jgi:hypothetical protein
MQTFRCVDIRRLLLLLLLCIGFLWSGYTNAGNHALLIGIGHYSPVTGASALPGVSRDMLSATQIAGALGIGKEQIRMLTNADATKEAILREIQLLAERVQSGERVMLYFSGHGTRWFDPQASGCVEGLLTFDGNTIVHRELAEALQILSRKADKLIIMLDACHSAGILPTNQRLRSTRSESPPLQPKFFLRANRSEADGKNCAVPVNMRTRSLLREQVTLGEGVENLIQISSSYANEVSFDDPQNGGLATQAIRDCMLGDAMDLDASGAISLAEIETCARQKIRVRLSPYPDLLPHHPTVLGLRGLLVDSRMVEDPVPAVAAAAAETEARRQQEQARLAAEAEARRQQEQARLAAETEARRQQEQARLAAETSRVLASLEMQPSIPPVIPPVFPDDPPMVVPEPTPEDLERQQVEAALLLEDQAFLTAHLDISAGVDETARPGPLATLHDILAQRDVRHDLDVQLRKSRLKIDRDLLEFSITSQRDGYLYILHMEPEFHHFTLLFPNSFQSENRIHAQQTIQLPRLDWQLISMGPAGTSHLLVLVSDTRRDPATWPVAAEEAPFLQLDTDLANRQRLLDFILERGLPPSPFGAALLSVEEF